MVRIENIYSKLSLLRKVLKKLERYRALPIDQIIADQDLQGATERYLFLASQCAIDASEMYCKLKSLGKVESMSQTFELLHEAGVIDQALCSSMIRMVGFRNALSHGYENLDYRIVDDVLRNKLSELERLAQCLERAV
jgi:uncharacterized protein YutE (UPF0331/DUF86 family)